MILFCRTPKVKHASLFFFLHNFSSRIFDETDLIIIEMVGIEDPIDNYGCSKYERRLEVQRSDQ